MPIETFIAYLLAAAFFLQYLGAVFAPAYFGPPDFLNVIAGAVFWAIGELLAIRHILGDG
jgi:hypothetical protein